MTQQSSRSEYHEIIERLRELKERNGDKDKESPAPIPLIDPTANVTALIKTETRRQDDLRWAEAKRIDDLMSQRVMYEDKLTESGEKLSSAESKRIDAIRAVDVAAVGVASERATQQANVLANQVTTSADTQRNLVASTAATIAQQFQQVTNTFAERLAVLEKSQYETKGGIGTPPIWAQGLIESVMRLQQGRERGEGRGEGIQKFIGWIIAAATLGAILVKFILR